MYKKIQNRKSKNKIPFWKEILDSQKKNKHGDLDKNIVPVKLTNANHPIYCNFSSWRVIRN